MIGNELTENASGLGVWSTWFLENTGFYKRKWGGITIFDEKVEKFLMRLFNRGWGLLE